MSPATYKTMADAVLVLHFCIVVFVIFGLPLILAGGALHWAWVRNFWFRIAHLAAIVYVAAQQLLGIACPLTNLEVWLRVQAGQATYEGDFVAHWLARLMFYQAPPWVFTVLYAAFALAVALSWYYVRPSWSRHKVA